MKRTCSGPRARRRSATASPTPGTRPCCAAGLANLDILEREQLVARVAELEPVIADAVRADAPSSTSSPRCAPSASSTGIEFKPEVLAATPGFADKASVRARENGVVTRALRGVGLQFSPPFVTTPEQLQGMADGMAAGIRDDGGGRQLGPPGGGGAVRRPLISSGLPLRP